MNSRTRKVRTFLLPSWIGACDSAGTPLAGESAVIIDVLRASTTVTHALRAGAAAIYPCRTIDETREKASRLRRLVQEKNAEPHQEPVGFGSDQARVFCGGERGGEPIAGFDFGNSPTEYVTEVVQNSLICFTTTNGTAALSQARSASKILVGCINNRSAVARGLANDAAVALVCAGTDGELSAEDVLGAGAIIDALVEIDPNWDLDDSSRLALMAWQAVRQDSNPAEPLSAGDDFETAEDLGRENSASKANLQLAEELKKSLGGRNLMRLERATDIELASEVDTLIEVAVFDENEECLLLDNSPKPILP